MGETKSKQNDSLMVKGIWKRFLFMLYKSRLPYFWLIVTLIISLVKPTLDLMFPDYLSDLLMGDYRLELVLLCMGVMIASAIFSLLTSTFEGVTQAVIDRNMQRSALRKLMRVHVSEAEKENPRFFISRITTDTSKVSALLLKLLIREIPRLYYMVTSVAILFTGYDIRLGLTVLSTIPVTILGGWAAGKLRFGKAENLQTQIARLTGVLAEKINNLPIIKSYNREAQESAAGKAVLDDVMKARKQFSFVTQVSAILTAGIVSFVPELLCVCVGAYLVLTEQVTAGDFAAFYMYSSMFSMYVTLHSDLWADIKEAQGATFRLAQIMSMPEEPTSGKQTPVTGDVEFRNVDFSYGDAPVLRSVSFTAKAGEKTVLVGFSGSGKTTAINLLEQFYAPQSGKVTVGGEDVASWNRKSFRSCFTYVPQNAPAMNGTIRDAITYGITRSVSDQEVWSVLEQSGSDAMVKKLGGLDYQVGTGAEKLSGGQRQRLCIARALLSDTEYMLLDEPTSALDADSAVRLQRTLDEKMKGRTMIAVTHDLKSAVNADKIIVMDKGQILAQGKHEELLVTCPLYAEFARLQKGGVNE